MSLPSNAPTNVPDGVERLGVDGVLRALQGMQVKVALDQCMALMRKWGAERRVTPQRKVILSQDVEEAIGILKGQAKDPPGGAGPGAEPRCQEPPAADGHDPPLQKRRRTEGGDAAVPPGPATNGVSPNAAPAPAAAANGAGRRAAPATDAADDGAAAATAASGGGSDKAAASNGGPAVSNGHAGVAPAAAKEADGGQAAAADGARGEAEPAGGGEGKVPPADAAGRKKQERQQRAKEEREKARREQEERQAEEDRLRLEKAAPFEGLSLEQMREKRLAEVLGEMNGRMRDIARRTATALGGQAPDDGVLDQVCGSALDVDRREAYMRLIHTVHEPVSIPEGLQAELMPYQVDGLEWLVSIYMNNLHGILADEMGLGKTLQTIAWLQYLKEFKNNKGPHLIVAPKSVLTNWESEFHRFAPTYKVWLLVGVQEERDQLASKLKKRTKHNQTTVFVTNYEQIHRNEWLQAFDWQCIVIDEGHKMKNQKSVLHETMTKMRCRTRMLLTGTPLQNNMNELWALLHYLLPELFTTTLDFQQWFLEPLKGVRGLNEYEVQLRPEDEAQIISRLHTMLAPFLIQRTKAQVMDNRLPPKTEATVRVTLSAWQRRAYSDLEKRTIRLLSNTEDKVETRKVNNALMQLRKLVLHPYLFMSTYKQGPDLYRTSGKVEVLDRMLAKLLPAGHKTLVFSQFTSVLDVLGAYLEWRGYSFVRLDGSTPHEERSARIRLFNAEERSGPQVFLLSSRAGGLGLNLQSADTVILFDLDWNPQNDKQAVARAHRIGQQREVRVFRLITESAVERHMEQRCREKLDLEKKIIGAGMFAKGSSHEQRADMLRSILGLADAGGAAAGDAVQPVEEGTSTEELNNLLARGPDELQDFGRLDADLLGGGPASAGEALPLLVRCGRLMREEEVPDGFRLDEEGSGGEEDPW